MRLDVAPQMLDELHAIVLQTVLTAGLAVLCWWLYREYRKPVFAWWAAAWGLYVLRPVAIGAFIVGRNPILLYWHQVLTGWTALAVLATALVFSRQLRWQPWYLLLIAFPPVWSYVAIYRIENFLLAAGPAVLFLSAATLWTGVVFWRYARRSRSPGAAVLAVAFLLWGVHHLDYPFLRRQGAWTPWGYYLDVLFTLAVGVGILLLIIDDLRRGTTALATLSSAWEGASSASRDALLDVVLARAAALPAVRGAVLVRAGDGMYERGAGVCAGWTGMSPDVRDAAVVREALVAGVAAVTPSWSVPAGDDGAAGTSTRRGTRPYPYAAVLPVPAGDHDALALVIVADAHEPFAALDTAFLTALGRQVGGALAYAALFDALRRRTADLERISARMVVQHEEERLRLSRELHDETAQLLTAVKMELGVLRAMLAPEQADRVDDALALTDAGIRSIRAVLQDLRPSLLDDLGLLPALRSMVTAFGERSGMVVSIELPEAAELLALGEDVELALFRAVQEALSNVGRHAGARSVSVVLHATPGHLVLRVCDDGRGPGPDGTSSGTGVAGIRERFARHGGGATLRPVEGGGACLEVTLPVHPDAGPSATESVAPEAEVAS